MLGNARLRVLLEEPFDSLLTQGVEPLATFLDLLHERYAGLPRGPFNVAARRRAGFSEQEMAALTAGLAD